MKREQVEENLNFIKKSLDEIIEAHYSGKLSEESSDLLIDWCWEEFGLSIGTPDTN